MTSATDRVKHPRVALLGLYHESNTFARELTGLADFASVGIWRGRDLWDAFAGSEATIGGYIAAAPALGLELVPLLFAQANPSGTVEAATFTQLRGELREALESGGPWDGVLLALHGAAVAEGEPDVDGAIIADVRAVVGPDVPVGVSLDLHANVSERMIDGATATVLYRTNPHLDASIRASECAALIARTIRGEVAPVQHLERPPLAVNILRQSTDAAPMSEIAAAIAEMEMREGVLSASLAMGYPYADVAEMGMAFLVVTDGDADLARDGARELAALAWSLRHELDGGAVSAAVALEMATDGRPGPVLVLDTGDNIGGGSPGDSTAVLSEARRRGIGSYLETICDPEAVARCGEAGEGAEIALTVGGRVSTHTPSCGVRGTVRKLAAGPFEDHGPTHGGFRSFDTGPTAVFETEQGQTLVLTSRAVVDCSVERHRSLGLAPETFQVIVAKGVHSPMPSYGPVASEAIFAGTPGPTSADLSTFGYQHRRRPLFPLERDAGWS